MNAITIISGKKQQWKHFEIEAVGGERRRSRGGGRPGTETRGENKERPERGAPPRGKGRRDATERPSVAATAASAREDVEATGDERAISATAVPRRERGEML